MKKFVHGVKRFLKEFINITLQSECQPHISDIISFAKFIVIQYLGKCDINTALFFNLFAAAATAKSCL